MTIRTLQTQIFLPAGGRNCPARPRDQPIFPLVEGSRRRIRLLRVHSHSHGGHPFSAGTRKLRGEKPRAETALAGCFALAFVCVCRVHGAVFLPCSGKSLTRTDVFSILSELSRFFKQIRSKRYGLFAAFAARRVDFSARSIYNEANCDHALHTEIPPASGEISTVRLLKFI
ncbi:MAG TPA: hypothetical protein VN538_11855 [Clostridia bacterium]|nr:hypothetical protein [Clostridia bacterium]